MTRTWSAEAESLVGKILRDHTGSVVGLQGRDRHVWRCACGSGRDVSAPVPWEFAAGELELHTNRAVLSALEDAGFITSVPPNMRGVDMMTLEEAKELIGRKFVEPVDVSPEPVSWWHDRNRLTFIDLLDQAVAWGLTPRQAVHLLGEALAAVADEYGD